MLNMHIYLIIYQALLDLPEYKKISMFIIVIKYMLFVTITGINCMILEKTRNYTILFDIL